MPLLLFSLQHKYNQYTLLAMTDQVHRKLMNKDLLNIFVYIILGKRDFLTPNRSNICQILIENQLNLKLITMWNNTLIIYITVNTNTVNPHIWFLLKWYTEIVRYKPWKRFSRRIFPQPPHYRGQGVFPSLTNVMFLFQLLVWLKSFITLSYDTIHYNNNTLSFCSVVISTFEVDNEQQFWFIINLIFQRPARQIKVLNTRSHLHGSVLTHVTDNFSRFPVMLVSLRVLWAPASASALRFQPTVNAQWRAAVSALAVPTPDWRAECWVL